MRNFILTVKWILSVYCKAISDFTETIRLDPNYANAFYGRGIAYLQTGNRAEADADLATAKLLEVAQ